jgi:hypothetical protein
MTRFRTLLAVLVIVQFVGSCSAHATPGCSATMPVTNTSAPTSSVNSSVGSSTSQDQADYCQYHYGSGDSGNYWGSATAPTPDGALCAQTPCNPSNGVRQDAGVINILYNNFYTGMTSATTTTCRFIDNDNTVSSTGDLFVPQRSLREYTNFVESAPKIAAAYCVQGQANYPYTATASYVSGYELWGNGGPVTNNAGLTTSSQAFNLPTTRLGQSSPTEPQSPAAPISFSYKRQDCTKDAAGTTLCKQRNIVETQTVVFATVPSTNSPCSNPLSITVDCDGSWGGATIAVSCSVDGITYLGTGAATCLADYSPPTPAACGTEADGTTWSSAVAGSPATSVCPTGSTGTQSCPTTVTSTYTCNNGTSILDSSSAVTGTSCTGCTPTSSPPPAPTPANECAGLTISTTVPSESSTVTLTASAESFSGNDTEVDVNGSNITGSVIGNGNYVNVIGTNNTIDVTGNNNFVQASGSNGIITVTGTGNTLIATGSGESITAPGASLVLTGSNASVALSGAGTQAEFIGTNESITFTNADNSLICSESGSDNMLNVTGNGAAVDLGFGTGNAVTLTGSGDAASASGSDNVIDINGATATATITNGSGNSIDLTGSGSTASISNGSDNTIIVVGAGSSGSACGGTENTISATNGATNSILTTCP